MQIKFSENALSEFMDWQSQDRHIAKKLNKLIKEMIRNPYEGIGKPEPLKHDLSGQWSRRIDDKNRIVYYVDEDGDITITKCKGHY